MPSCFLESHSIQAEYIALLLQLSFKISLYADAVYQQCWRDFRLDITLLIQKGK